MLVDGTPAIRPRHGQGGRFITRISPVAPAAPELEEGSAMLGGQ